MCKVGVVYLYMGVFSKLLMYTFLKIDYIKENLVSYLH